MAITFRASGAATVNGSGTTATLTMPAAVQAGDVVIVNLVIQGDQSSSLVSTDGAFVLLKQIVSASNMYGIWRRVAQSGDASSVFTWTWATNGLYGLAESAYVGVDDTTPEDAATTDWITAQSNIQTCPSITTVTDGAMLIAAVVVRQNTNITSAPTGYTSRAEAEANSRKAGIADKIQVTAGASGTADWTLAGEAQGAALHAALRPATTVQTISPTGIASTLLFGLPELSSLKTLLPESIASTTNVSSPILTSEYLILPSSIESTLVTGSHTVKGTNVIIVTGIDSTLVLGLPIFRAYIHPVSIDSTLILPTPVLTSILNILPVAVAPASVLGTPILTSVLIIAPDSVNSELLFGTVILTSLVNILPNGINSILVFGTSSISIDNNIFPDAINSTLVFGSSKLNSIIHIAGLDSTLVVGAHHINSEFIITSVGIASTLVISTPVLSLFNSISPESIFSGIIIPESVKLNLTIFPNSLINTNQFGTSRVLDISLNTILLPIGIGSTIELGIPRLILNAICYYDWTIHEYIWIPSEFVRTIPELLISQGPYPGKHDWTS